MDELDIDLTTLEEATLVEPHRYTLEWKFSYHKLTFFLVKTSTHPK